MNASLAPIAFWLLAGVVGVALLAVGCWYAAKIAWRPPTDDAAPRTHLPSLHELRARRDRR